jgi:Mg2+/Co2+ transporter CorB
MMFAGILFLIGLALSAFFSGTETGLYRVSRTRLVLDGLSGSGAAKGLVWLLNHPAIFVATMLVGNNVANYLASFAIVTAVSILFVANPTAELIGPILMTPIVFVLGELLPKSLFYHAPYRLLTAARPFVLLAAVLFAPISLVLGLLGNLLRLITGKTPFQLRLAMARGELDQVLQAGEEAGILVAGQRSLAQKLFEVGNQPAVMFGVQPDRLPVIDAPVDVVTALHQARRRNHPIVLVRRAGRVIGYLRYADLNRSESIDTPRSVIRGRVDDRHLKTLLRLYDAASDVAILFDDSGEMRFVVTRRQLLQALVK